MEAVPQASVAMQPGRIQNLQGEGPKPRHFSPRHRPRRNQWFRQSGQQQTQQADQQPAVQKDKDTTEQQAGQNQTRQQQPLRAALPNCVTVTGFPGYTRRQDLVKVFSQFGQVNVERINGNTAYLTFSNKDEAEKAIQASQQVNIYCKFLTVKNFNGSIPPWVDRKQHKREFPRTKQKTIITEPSKIDLSGDFHEQLDAVLSAIRLTKEEVTALSQLYADLEAVLQGQWPGCTAIPFGSIPTGLGIKTSDADCFIMIPPHFKRPNENFVNKAKKLLRKHPQTFAEILAIPQANTPIVKFFHIPTEINCDVSFKTPLGARNSQLVAFLLHADTRLLPLAVFIKYWARVHQLSGTGRLTNYALVMLFIFYLQSVSVLPPVRYLQNPEAPQLVDYWDAGFNPEGSLLPPRTKADLPQLLGGFFEYYANFDFRNLVVCPYLGNSVKKEVLKDLNKLPPEFELYKHNVENELAPSLRVTTSMCVQDPFELCHNVASTINVGLAEEIVAYFKFAADAYEKGKANSFQDFLRTILLHKPVIPRKKSKAQYLVKFRNRLLDCIKSDDWKSVVRTVAFAIFEDTLKIKLNRVEQENQEGEETLKEDKQKDQQPKKTKEKYNATITHAIWRRKQFSKLYDLMKMPYMQKQARITEEIINADKNIINVQFQLMISYSNRERLASLIVTHESGDLNLFRDFGKFYVVNLHNWFTSLLKPYLIEKAVSVEEAPLKAVDNMSVDVNTDSEDETSVETKTETTNTDKEKNEDFRDNKLNEVNDNTQTMTEDQPDIIIECND